jgi:hypothetical protein
MTNYFSITPQKLDSNTSLNMNNQVIYGVNELSFSQTNDLCTIASNLFAPQFIFTNSIAYDINAVPTIVFYLNNTNNVGLNSPLSINTTAVDINNNLFINSGADITLSSGTAILGNAGAPNTISNVNLTSSTATTPPTTDNDTSIATTAYVKNNLLNYATLASPVFTGNPTAPTPQQTDADFSIATTAYVTTKVTNATQVVRNGLTYTIPSSNLSNTPQTADNTISNTTSTVFCACYFTPTVTATGPYAFNFNTNLYNGTFSSLIIQNYTIINTSNGQSQFASISVSSPTQIAITNLSVFYAGSQYYVNVSLVIAST